MNLSLQRSRRENAWRKRRHRILQLPVKKPVVDMQLGGAVKMTSRRHGRNLAPSASVCSSAALSAPSSGQTSPPPPPLPPRRCCGSVPRPPTRAASRAHSGWDPRGCLFCSWKAFSPHAAPNLPSLWCPPTPGGPLGRVVTAHRRHLGAAHGRGRAGRAGDLHPGGPRPLGGGRPVLSPAAAGAEGLREGSRGRPARARPRTGRAVTMVTAAGPRRPGLSHAAARSAVHCGLGEDGRLLDAVVRGVGLSGAAGRISPSPPASRPLPVRSSPIHSRPAGVRGSWEPRWAGRGSRRRECRARGARGASGGPGPGPHRHLGPPRGREAPPFSEPGRGCCLRAAEESRQVEGAASPGLVLSCTPGRGASLCPCPVLPPASPPLGLHLPAGSLGPCCVLGWRLLLTCCLALPLWWSLRCCSRLFWGLGRRMSLTWLTGTCLWPLWRKGIARRSKAPSLWLRAGGWRTG